MSFPKFSRFDIPLILYAFVCGLCLFGATLGLRRLIADDTKSVQEATLMVASPERAQTTMADNLHAAFGSRIVLADRPENAAFVRSLFGTRPFSTPALIIKYRGKNDIFTGAPSVAAALDELTSPTAKTRQAVRAVAVTAMLLLFAASMKRWIAYGGVVWPALGAIALAFAPSGCPTCYSGASRFEQIVPIVGALGFLAVTVTMLFRRTLSGRIPLLLIFFSVGAIALQAVLLVSHPKFCTSCVVASACLIGVGMVALAAIDPNEIPALAGSRRYWPVALVALGLTGTGFARIPSTFRAPLALSHDLPELQGKMLLSVGIPPNGKPGNSLYIVTRDGCESCEAAKAALISEGIDFVPVHPCEPGEHDGCYETRGASAVPMFLVAGQEGKIMFQSYGWNASPPVRADFVQRLNALLAGGKQTQ